MELYARADVATYESNKGGIKEDMEQTGADRAKDWQGKQLMKNQTFCPACEEVLTVDLFPEFLYCEGCEMGAKKVECRKSREQIQANFGLRWVTKHDGELSAKLRACSITQRVKKEFGSVRSILDLGCGSGLLVDILIGEGYDSTGFDFSSRVINYARSHKRGLYIYGTIDDIWKQYDLVIMSHLLEHIEKPVEYLRRVANLIKPSGLLLLVVPNLDGYDPDSMWRRESHITLFDHTHNMAFSKKGLTLLLEKAGYMVLMVSSETLGAALLGREVQGLYRRLRGNGTIYRKQKPASISTPDKVHRVYKTIVESSLVRFLCYIPNKWSERGGRGIDLVVLAAPKKGRTSILM